MTPRPLPNKTRTSFQGCSLNNQNPKHPIGFLTIVHVPELGFCGGFLLINSLGRPVEFHCTAPVQENKTQKILYGKTYPSFLFCDQIGRALVAKSKLTAGLIIANRTELAAMKDSLSQPLLVLKNSDDPDDNTDSPTPINYANEFSVNQHQLAYLGTDDEHLRIAKSYCQTLAETIPLDEPFERICQAIDEAQAVIR